MDSHPQHPENIITIVAMSDTHDQHHKININELPKADIFIHAGDFTKYSKKDELERFRQFLQSLPYKHKIVIAGNHDFALDKDSYIGSLDQRKHMGNALDTAEEIKKLKEVCTYLHHEEVEVEGIKIFGSPYSLEFCDWGFMYPADQGEKLWSAIPEKTDVLITHGPPYGILDKTIRGENVGCKALLEVIKKIEPQVHIFGHIHEEYGKVEMNGTRFYNACNVNLSYKISHPPHVMKVIRK